ncbi:MAG: DUF4124 domain-containing protein [Methylophilaceae bacterium]
MYRSFTLLLVLSMLPALAAAEVYQCKDAGGKTSFSDRPCAVGSSMESAASKSPTNVPAESAVSKDVYTKDTPAMKAPDAATQACFDSVNTNQYYPDPSTTKLVSSSRKIVAVKNVGARQLLTIETTSKNQAGIYVGKQLHKCLLMGDGVTINTRPYELL